jgi:4-hydroxy-3-methylbut-2-enyl diphosphate reductase
LVFYERRDPSGQPQEIFWPSRAAFVPGWTAPSKSSSVRCQVRRPIYVRHEIVHNTYVVNDLKAKGAIFIEDLADVPPGATLVFSAHGVSKAVQEEARARGFRFLMPPAPW